MGLALSVGAQVRVWLGVSVGDRDREAVRVDEKDRVAVGGVGVPVGGVDVKVLQVAVGEDVPGDSDAVGGDGDWLAEPVLVVLTWSDSDGEALSLRVRVGLMLTVGDQVPEGTYVALA